MCRGRRRPLPETHRAGTGKGSNRCLWDDEDMAETSPTIFIIGNFHRMIQKYPNLSLQTCRGSARYILWHKCGATFSARFRYLEQIARLCRYVARYASIPRNKLSWMPPPLKENRGIIGLNPYELTRVISDAVTGTYHQEHSV